MCFPLCLPERNHAETWQGGFRLDSTKNISCDEEVQYQTISLKEVVKCRFFSPPRMVLAYLRQRQEMEHRSSRNDNWKWHFCDYLIILLCSHKKGSGQPIKQQTITQPQALPENHCKVISHLASLVPILGQAGTRKGLSHQAMWLKVHTGPRSTLGTATRNWHRCAGHAEEH